jgi:hypothetical protein
MPVAMVQAGDGGPVGFFAYKTRKFNRADLQTGNHLPLRVINTVDGWFRERKWLQSHFDNLRVNGTDWFLYSDEMLTVRPPSGLTERSQICPPDAAAIPLTDGWKTFVSPEDLSFLWRHSWFVKLGGTSKLYAARWQNDGRKNRMVLLHRVLLDAPAGPDVDHINGDGLDNRRCNLRFATRSQNIANSRNRQTGQSGYRGVYAHPNGRFYATLEILGKKKCFGGFATAVEAAKAYDAGALEHWGEFAVCNFPSPQNTSLTVEAQP